LSAISLLASPLTSTHVAADDSINCIRSYCFVSSCPFINFLPCHSYGHMELSLFLKLLYLSQILTTKKGKHRSLFNGAATELSLRKREPKLTRCKWRKVHIVCISHGSQWRKYNFSDKLKLLEFSIFLVYFPSLYRKQSICWYIVNYFAIISFVD
jgi:hypothetical protein